MAQKNIRVRFAPSPTGPLHIGGVRTALFNYLFARKHNGTFIIRIEDTDQTRFVAQAEQYIIESLQWCGITIDEGIGAENIGPHAPYRQSERKDIYKQYALQLIESGNAYYAFDTAEDLADLRTQGEQSKTPFVYNAESRLALQNSLTLSPEDVQKKLQADEQYVIRFKMPENTVVQLHDEIRKDFQFNTKELDDKVLFKSDGLPTYHLANVVDDYLMQISHVIRGEEWLSSMPLHVLLYKALGWEESMPVFAHLPLILKPQGQGKLSKRDGDKHGFPVFPLNWLSSEGDLSAGYREAGYLPEGFVNMLALLGWNPGTEQEIFTMQELIEAFSLDRVGKSGSKFDPEKSKWFNHQWMQKTSPADLAQLFVPCLHTKGIQASQKYIEKVTALVQERASLIPDLWTQAHYFFQAPTTYDEKVVAKRWDNSIPLVLSDIAEIIAAEEFIKSEILEAKIKQFIADKQLKMGQVFNCLRLCLVGSSEGVHLFDIIETIGKEQTLQRIHAARESIGLL